jgi:alkaline phosphatase
MAFAAQAIPAAGSAKNVILMIGDGMGFNTVKATEYYTGSQAVYENFSVRYGMNTNSAGAAGGYVGAAYDPTKMWNSFTYPKSGATDSASAATAMYSGVKNYDNQINVSTSGQSIVNYFEYAAMAGKATGAVSTVNFTHATPAAVATHTTNRNDYATIASQMVNSSLDVIMGAGNPFYDNNGQLRATPNYGIVGNQANWNALNSQFQVIQSKSDFEALANGTLTGTKVAGIAQAYDTLQSSRSNPAGNFDPLNQNVPTLATMAKGALNVLSQDQDGFAVMIEGGAIDWANHSNLKDRMLEETVDFNNAVQSVVDYLNNNTNGVNFGNTLLIVTADHETGHLWGNTLGSYNQVIDNGAGNIPGMAFNSGSHTNALVPLYAMGAGADIFNSYVMGVDAQLAAQYGQGGFDGKFIDNTKVFAAMATASGVATPIPAAFWLLGSGLLGVAGIRKRR